MVNKLFVMTILVLATALAAGDIQATDEEPVTETITLGVEGMTCSTCELRLERALERIDGVVAVDADLESESVTVNYEPEKVDKAQLNAGIRNAGFEPTPEPKTEP